MRFPGSLIAARVNPGGNMSDLVLTARKRAFPSTGRARINEATLKELGVNERDDIDIGTTAKDRWITVSAFSDSLVGLDEIRLSTEDLSALGIEEGTAVVVEKNVPLREQVEKSVHAAGDHLAGELAGLKGKILETVEPVTAKAQATAQDAYSRVTEELPTKDDISRAIDDARKKIAPKFAPRSGTLLTLLSRIRGLSGPSPFLREKRQQLPGSVFLPGFLPSHSGKPMAGLSFPRRTVLSGQGTRSSLSGTRPCLHRRSRRSECKRKYPFLIFFSFPGLPAAVAFTGSLWDSQIPRSGITLQVNP